ncbi:MAG: hypothetical protein GY696_35070, partial [Gammaproteobacteria bacterium]|nr:hypothetical protein [Gammaproteobacteria bacterium]
MSDDPPISKTQRYKKITKPLLERKRRARMNACLEELKELMTSALQAEGENVSKLEKADILELTVRHLHKLNQSQRLTGGGPRNPLEDVQKFQAGYSSCAQEATNFLMTTPGLNVRVGHQLLGHLFNPASLTNAATAPPLVPTASMPSVPSSLASNSLLSIPSPSLSAAGPTPLSGALPAALAARLSHQQQVIPPASLINGLPHGVKPEPGMLQALQSLPGVLRGLPGHFQVPGSSAGGSLPVFNHLSNIDVKPNVSQLPAISRFNASHLRPVAATSCTVTAAVTSIATQDVKPSLAELEQMKIFRPAAVRPNLNGKEINSISQSVWKP